METLLISIIVPVFNLEKELRRCIGSITRQTYKNLEIIIVDDGSSDNTGELIKGLANEDPRIIPLSKENGGVTTARLAGCRIAKGDYIGFVDGDDEIEPDMYERLINNALKYDADISHCGYQMVFEDGRVHFFYNTGKMFTQDTLRGIKDLLKGSIIEPGLCNKIYRKKLIAELFEKMDTSIKINEDLLMNYYLFSQSRTSIFDDWCPYHYLVRKTSSSRSKINRNKSLYDPITVKQIIFDNCTNELKVESERALLISCIHSYRSIAMKPRLRTDRWKIRSIIMNHRCAIPLLHTKMLFSAKMIIWVPFFYQILYIIYAKFFKRSPWD